MTKSKIPIETLLVDLRSSDTSTRDNAARELGKSRDPRAVDALLIELGDENWKVRRNAAQALGVAKDKRAVEPLIAALEDRVATVRCRAAVALGRLKDPRAIEPMIAMLAVTHTSDAYKALTPALLKFGKAASPALVQALAIYPERRQSLIQLLGEIEPGAALDPLLEALHDPDPMRRDSAAYSLSMLDTSDPRVMQALRSLLPQADQMLQIQIIRSLGKWGVVEAVPEVLTLLMDHELYSQNQPLYRIIAVMMQTLGDIPDNLCGVVKNDLAGLIGLAQQLNPSLTDQMLTTEHVAERLKAFGFPMPMGKSILERLVMVGTAPELQQDRLTGLLFLLNASNPLTRIGAALGLPWFMDRRALDPLRQAARDPDPNVRTAAQWAFAALERALYYQQQLADRKKD